MRQRVAHSAVALFILVSARLLAQGIEVGELPRRGGATLAGTLLVDLNRPATGPASLTTATIRWITPSASPCTSAFRIEVLRPVFGQLSNFTVVGERGPFNTPGNGGLVTVPLSPPIAVTGGDLLGVVQMQPGGSCGNVALTPANDSRSILELLTDVTSGVAVSGGVVRGLQLDAHASGDGFVLTGIIPAVGTVAGSNNSFFRTALQLANPDANPEVITGRLVFHPASQSAGPADPYLDFNVPVNGTVAWTDLVSSMGVSNRLGSLDILTTTSAKPIVAARVFNDNGSQGTQGFTEPMIEPRYVPGGVVDAWLIAPHDLANFRMNIGVRTLQDPVQIDVLVYPLSGSVATKSYPANYFEQKTLADFISPVTPSPDALIVILFNSGSAIVYGSTTDNRTNDSSIAIATSDWASTE